MSKRLNSLLASTKGSRKWVRFCALQREIGLIGICEKQDIFGKPFAEVLNPTLSPNSIAREPSDNDFLFVVIVRVITRLVILLLLNMTRFTADKIRD